MLVFQNNGLIDVFGITTFGASAKESENPIGFFGTGLKYAISVILRHKGKISIWRGNEEFEFSTKIIDSRGKSFEVITMNGEPLSFTTELGKTWEMWQAFRELFCNAKDEGGDCKQMSRYDVRPSAETTVICVESREMDDAYSQVDSIILNAKVIYQNNKIRIFSGNSDYLFYRGVRVGSFNKPTFFTYDILQSTTLSEDRALKETYTAGILVAQAIQDCDNKRLIDDALTTGKSFFESDAEYQRYYNSSPEFNEVLRALKSDLTRPLNRSAIALRLDDDLSALDAGLDTLDARKTSMLNRSIAFLERMGMMVTEYPIVVTDQLGAGIMGRAHKGRIFLSEIPFDKGVKQVVATLFEEWIHLKHGVHDETRAMQDILMEKMIEQAEYRFEDFL